MFVPSTAQSSHLRKSFVRGHSRCTRQLRTVTRAYAQPNPIKAVESPRDVLGVSQEASQTEIKTAFRKLALKYHPDRQGDETRFMEVLRAYEILTGKAEGKEGLDNESWDFHDWYWRFAMSRSRGNAHPRSTKVKPDLSSQLAGLRKRAAVRAAKERAEQSVSSDPPTSEEFDYVGSDDCPSDSGVGSERTTFEQELRYASESRRRAGLNSSEMKESIASQLTGLKRKAKIRVEL